GIQLRPVYGPPAPFMLLGLITPICSDVPVILNPHTSSVAAVNPSTAAFISFQPTYTGICLGTDNRSATAGCNHPATAKGSPTGGRRCRLAPAQLNRLSAG